MALVDPKVKAKVQKAFANKLNKFHFFSTHGRVISGIEDGLQIEVLIDNGQPIVYLADQLFICDSLRKDYIRAFDIQARAGQELHSNFEPELIEGNYAEESTDSGNRTGEMEIVTTSSTGLKDSDLGGSHPSNQHTHLHGTINGTHTFDFTGDKQSTGEMNATGKQTIIDYGIKKGDLVLIAFSKDMQIGYVIDRITRADELVGG